MLLTSSDVGRQVRVFGGGTIFIIRAISVSGTKAFISPLAYAVKEWILPEPAKNLTFLDDSEYIIKRDLSTPQGGLWK